MDHVYLLTSSTSVAHQWFNSRYQAQVAEDAAPGTVDLKWIDNGYADNTTNNCTMSWGTAASPSSGLLQCKVYGVGAASSHYEWWTTWNAHEPKLRGLSWPTTPGGRRGASLMTYRYEPPDWAS